MKRRTALKRTAAAGVPLAAAVLKSGASGSGTVRAHDCSDSTTMTPGERHVVREAGENDGCCGWTIHTDYNWCLTFIGENRGDYEFGASTIFHIYKEREDDVDPMEKQSQVKLDVEIDNYDERQTTLTEETKPTEGEEEKEDYKGKSYSTVRGAAKWDWHKWYNENEGENPDESDIREKWNSTDYGDGGEIPEWVSNTAFAAAVGASAVSGGALAVLTRGASTAVSALEFVDWIKDFEDDTGKDYKSPAEQGNDRYYYWWDYNGDMALTISCTRFTVEVGEYEYGDVHSKVLQSFEPNGYNTYDTPNCGEWNISVPTDSDENPRLCSMNTYIDNNGHSHPSN